VPSDRAVLHQRIGQRFDAMLHAGLVDEVDRCAGNTGSTPVCLRCAASATARCGRCWKDTLPRAELRDRGVFATRQFAKRQLTWLKSMDDLRPFDPLAADPTASVLAAVEAHLADY
jgi:tRNA dimethylallyltransferase